MAALPGPAQTMAPVGVDLFGDRIVEPLERGAHFSVLRIGPVSTPGYEHGLLFQDGRQLRGTLVELTASARIRR